MECDPLFLKLVGKLMFFKNDEELFKKQFLTARNYQIYETKDQKINFDRLTFDEKQNFIVKIICQMTDFDMNKSTCNWSTSTMPLHGCGNIIISFLNHIEFDIVCTQLRGINLLMKYLILFLICILFFFFEKMPQIFQTKFLEQEFKEFYQVIIRI